MAVYVAVLRAINVGGTGKLPMKELKTACEEAGLARVSTYIASGNLVFDCSGSAAQAKAIVASVLRDRFNLSKNHTIIRTPDDLADALAANPFPDAAADRPSQLLLHFLDEEAAPGAVEALTAYCGPERIHLDGLHLYVDFVEGAGRSKLTPAFLDKALKVPATTRNWNTSRTLLEMALALQS